MEPIGKSIPDARADFGGVSRNTIYRMIARGELEAIKIGARTIITTESIKARLASAPRLGNA